MLRSGFILLTIAFISSFSWAQSGHLVISQVYGAGGNTSAIYKNDFVELYNPTTAPINFINWSIQYASAASSTWSIVTISGTVAPGGYYLVQLFSNGANGADLPIADASASINLNTTDGKIALVDHNTALSGAAPTKGVIDFVGYGIANGFESAAAPAASAALGLLRMNSGCQDMDNNSMDFVTATPSPRNSSSPTFVCNSSSAIAVGPVSAPFCISATQAATGTVSYTAYGTFNTTFHAYLSDHIGSFNTPTLIGSAIVNGTDFTGSIPITIPDAITGSTGYKIQIVAASPTVTSSNSTFFEVVNGVLDITSFSGTNTGNTVTLNWTNPSYCFDEVILVAKASGSISAVPGGDGSAYTANPSFTGGGTSFDGGKIVYKGIVSGQTISNLTAGTTYYFKIFARRGTDWSTGVEINITPYFTPQPGEILINQLSPGYNSATDEYIELINTTNKTFDLSTLAIRYQSGGGVPASAGGNLSGILLPYHFWLLSPNATITVGANVATPRDGSINSGFNAAAGQIGLVRLIDDVVLDAVAYGTITAGTYIEVASAPTPPSNGGLKRVTDGVDGNNNGTDFITVTNSNIYVRNRFGAPLTVRFAQVRAAKEKDYTIVLFTNTSESDIAYYEVQRSTTFNSFITLGRMLPQNNQGGARTYQYKDLQPPSGISYYRIKGAEKSGHVVYSPVVIVSNFKFEVRETLYIHSIKGKQLYFETKVPSGNYTISIYNASGQELIKQTTQIETKTVHSVPVDKLRKGIYFLKLEGIRSVAKAFIME